MNNKQLNPFGQAEQSHGMAAASSDSQKAIAEIQAAMVIARANPRNQIVAMDNIINAFSRPSLAASAQYQYARGGTDIIGPSIRSAEAIAQLWGNIQFGFRELSRGTDEKGIGFSEVEAYAWDVETNTKRPTTFIVKHWRDTKKGGYAITDERDIYELTANMAQRRVRACILAVIPGDVVETAMGQVSVTLAASADCSPDSIQRMVEAFSEFGVTKELLELRIQRRLDAVQPAQVITLKRIYTSLRDGMSVPGDWFDLSQNTIQGDKSDGSAQSTSKGTAAVKAKARAKKPSNDDSGAITYAEVAGMINAATDTAQMDRAAEMANEIDNPGHSKELAGLLVAKAAELFGGNNDEV